MIEHLHVSDALAVVRTDTARDRRDAEQENLARALRRRRRHRRDA